MMDRFIAMRVFVDVVYLGSLTAAANKLDISRAMATRYIASLEKAFGTRLLHRTSRSLGLTGTGSEILSYCRQILALNEDIGAVIGSKRTEPHGLIRIASSLSFGQSYLAEAMRSYAALHPSVSVEMVLKDQSVNLVEQRLDLAIQVGDKLEQGVISRQLSRCTSVVCAAPDYLARWGVPQRPEALSAHNCLNHTRFGKNWHFRHTSANGTETTFDKFEVSGNFAANDSMVLLHAALAGDGIVHLPTFTTQAYLRSGALVRLFADYTLPALGIYALYSSRKYLPTNIRTLLEFLVDDMSETQCVDDPS